MKIFNIIIHETEVLQVTTKIQKNEYTKIKVANVNIAVATLCMNPMTLMHHSLR